MNPLISAQAATQEKEFSIFTAIDMKSEIAGIKLHPLTPGRLLLLESMSSAFITKKEVKDMQVIEEVIMALFILSCGQDDYQLILNYVTKQRAFVDALKLINNGEDPKTGIMFESYTKADCDILNRIAVFGDNINLESISDIYSDIADYIDKSFIAFSIIKKKVMAK